MLSKSLSRSRFSIGVSSQQGVVLLVALIMLVAMTLGGIALVRSVYTANIIAGNLAFHQAATNSADRGVQAAVAWLGSGVGSPPCGAVPAYTLAVNCYSQGYSTVWSDPPTTWDSYWATLSAAGRVVTAAPLADAAGNTVQYTIERLCKVVNAPAMPAIYSCVSSPVATPSGIGSSHGNPDPAFLASQTYYRITTRVLGPRSTVSYVQVIVTL